MKAGTGGGGGGRHDTCDHGRTIIQQAAEGKTSMIYIKKSRQIYSPSCTYDLANVAGWIPYNLHDLARASWVGSVLYR